MYDFAMFVLHAGIFLALCMIADDVHTIAKKHKK